MHPLSVIAHTDHSNAQYELINNLIFRNVMLQYFKFEVYNYSSTNCAAAPRTVDGRIESNSHTPHKLLKYISSATLTFAG